MSSIVDDLKSRVSEIEKLAIGVKEDAIQFEKNIRKDYGDLDRLLSKSRSKDKDIKILKGILSKEPNDKQVQAISKDLERHERDLLHSHHELKPCTGSFFVRLCMGQVNVKNYRHGERMKLKTEYQKFKFRTDFLGLFIVGIQLFLFPGNRFLQIASQAWLMYYYSSLSLRENILNVNGSHIRNWWIYHHYIMMVVTLGVLTWDPRSESYLNFERSFLSLNFGQSLIQILQTWYQSHKLYKMIALGNASSMEVNGSSLPKLSGPVQSITLLIPFLLFMQFYMLYLAYLLLSYSYTRGLNLEWQVPAVGICFLIIGFGNMSNTLDTYIDKLRGKVSK
eukprot:TRINITY_DN3625_c0_g1_i1.p1 TRINITY_DN3625_c0_g1~~TRINITY_DN3625_c0_g1_i1.p1  ORF type:complete len:336 (-),score=107.58 TRINITY_DN3625_c0_g1_i1:91-1098(-)